MSKFSFAPARSAKKRRTWCGPYAVAVLMGVDYDAAYDTCVRILRRDGIRGMYNSELERIMTTLGVGFRKWTFQEYTGTVTVDAQTDFKDGRWFIKPVTVNKHLTLNQWYKARADKQATYVINVSRHYVIVRGTRIIDNQQPEWKAWADRKGARSYKRGLVHGVWQID